MAGTDHRRLAASGGPAIILVNPQLGENIGAAVRAMYNCVLTDLRLVAPRDGWPNPKAVTMASGADVVLRQARLFDSVEDAVADLRHVYATTARDRFMVKRVLTPRRVAVEMRRFTAGGESCGVLFGPERTGLVNDHVALADAVLTVPLNPAFSTHSPGQTALLCDYSARSAGEEAPPAQPPTAHSPPATREELLRFFGH